jgi:hypothetical protein
MVSFNDDSIAKKHMAEVLQGFRDGKELLFGDWVAFLHISEFFTEEPEWFIVLTDNATYLLVTGIGMNDEGFVKVRVGQHRFVCHCLFHLQEGLFMFLFPFEFMFLPHRLVKGARISARFG